MSYDNTFFENEKEAIECEPLQMLHDIADNPSNNEIEDIIDMIESLKLGVTIDKQDFTWNEIKNWICSTP